MVAVPYFSTNNIASMYLDTVWDPEIALDRELPVVNWMILPYTLLYLFYPATLILCPRDERGHAELAVGMQTLIMVTAFCSSSNGSFGEYIILASTSLYGISSE